MRSFHASRPGSNAGSLIPGWTAHIYGLLLMLLALGALAEPSSGQLEMASQIRHRFESSLFELPPVVQAHWALRLYRATGEERYRFPILSQAVLLERNFLRDVKGWDDPDYRNRRIAQLMRVFENKSRKSRSRRALYERHPEELYLLNLLSSWHRLWQLGFAEESFETAAARARELLGRDTIAEFLLNEEVLHIYSPQAVNYVYYLHDLGIFDLREDFKDAFRQQFPDSADEELGRLRFKDKIYGLTHFILADSGYFQNFVDPDEHAWILDYFEENLDRIIERTKADIIAEVGLCFLLAGMDDCRALTRTRNSVASAFDPDHRMIPSVSGNADLRKGEHRNVLAYMLFSWPGELHPGPDLLAWEDIRRLLAP